MEIDAPSQGLIVDGLLMKLGHIAAISVYGSSNIPDKEPLILALVPGILVGLCMTVGGLLMRSFRSSGGALMGAIAAQLPLSPGWILSLPIGVIAYRTLQRPHIRQAIVRRISERREQWSDM